jgi:hypothetical protein
MYLLYPRDVIIWSIGALHRSQDLECRMRLERITDAAHHAKSFTMGRDHSFNSTDLCFLERYVQRIAGYQGTIVGSDWQSFQTTVSAQPIREQIVNIQ